MPMPIDKRWATLTPSDWDSFANAWIAELRGTTDQVSNVGGAVCQMNFTATPEQQWTFIMAALAHASDDELGHLAAGPVEHLLGWHGSSYIDEVERQAASNPKFARMLSRVWRYMMNDELWKRMEDLKAKYSGSNPETDHP
jgi:hypothetical protein